MSFTWTDFLRLSEGVTPLPDPQEVGVFLRFQAQAAQARHVFPLGLLTGIQRFTACHRYEPYWMTAKAGTSGGEVPGETQWLLAEADNGDCVVLVPLISGAFRCALQGTGEDQLELVAESGDPSVVTTEVTGLFVAVGPEPFALMATAARSVNAAMNMGRLRRDKRLPAFVDQFGWCTWDAFYQDVSHENVLTGLESFTQGGVQPKYLILDDGWQTIRTMPSGEKRLAAFDANENFPQGLRETVQATKENFGIETFLVWHAMTGYWGGVDGDTLPGYGVRSVARHFSPGIRHYGTGPEEYWGPVVGLVPPEQIYRFYQDYHRHLREAGVDGVKVDTQATLEGVAAGSGGRVHLMRCAHEGLEGSVQTQFDGNLINCMSCANEMLYGALASTLTRTSTDFFPNKPASHGLHLYVNAQVSTWFSEFIHPDWDMFQSAHPMGWFHAMGRAVSGSPVYVSDKPGAHDFDLLRRMVLPDGSVLRAEGPGRPTRDCLFHDPTREPVLLKVWNRSRCGAGLIGVFNCLSPEDGLETVSGVVSPADVPGLAGDEFAVYAHTSQELRCLAHDDHWEMALAPLTAEIVTLVPIVDGFAPIGLPEMFHSAGAIAECRHSASGAWKIRLHSGGRFLAWCETAPGSVCSEAGEMDFTFDAATHTLEVMLPKTVTQFWIRLYS